MNHHAGDQQTVLISGMMYPAVYTQIVPQQGEIIKPRRRRRKSAEESGTMAATKRKLSAEQADLLEKSFGSEHKLESERKDRLASELGLDPRQVAVWFQNRRARWKNKKLEEEYSELKTAHDNVVLEKCRLESQVVKLKEQLSEAEKDIQRLSERIDGAAATNSYSPSSSFSVEASAMDQPFLGDFGVGGFDNNVFYVPENIYGQGMDWVNNLYAL